jgi:ubiquinone/menaquinone biosynthesis C-methylase UbiE
MGAASLEFLFRAGLGPGIACLDVGCGDGQVAIELARQVGPSGRVVGVDNDAEALRLARRAAQEAGVEVDFVEADVTEPLNVGSFDLAFARLLLSHLADPMSVLVGMRSAVKPSGVVAVEDVFSPTLHAEPPVPVLDRLVEVYSATERYHGGDPALGPRLPALFRRAGLTDISVQTVENRMTTAYQKFFLAELLDNMRDAMLEAQAITSEDLDDLRAKVASAAERDDTVFVQAQMYQVLGRRPST